MSEFVSVVGAWLIPTLAVGGSILLLAWALMGFIRQPVRRRAVGSIAIRVALLVPLLMLGPKWISIRVPESVANVEPMVGSGPSTISTPVNHETRSAADGSSFDGVVLVIPADERVENNSASTTQPILESKGEAFVPVQQSISWPGVLLGLYALGSLFFLIRWLIGVVGLNRLVERSRPASPSLRSIFDRCTVDAGVSADLRVADKLSGPICCGLGRPIILIPQALAERADEESLRWVFFHELAHVKRNDAWIPFWFGLAQAIYFPLPWFWRLKTQIRLCQEFVADAEAVARSQVEEYAAFLLNLSRSARPRRHLAAVNGVLGSPSELFRRITMLLNTKSRVDRCCPRRWSLFAAGGLMSLAIVLSGLGVARESKASPVDPPKDEKKTDSKKETPKAEDPAKDPEEKPLKPEKRNAPRFVPFPRPEGVNPEDFERTIQKMLEEMQKRFEQGGFGGGAMVFPRGRFQMQPFGSFNSGTGRLGAVVEKPSAALVEHLDLPKDQGLVLNEIKADSAAAKAGLKANDILLEINGKPVPSDPQEFRAMLKDIKADATVDAVILRKNRRETIKGMKLPEVKEADNPFGNFKFEMPELPPLVLQPPVPPPPPPIPNAFGNASKSTSIQINNDQFTLSSREDELSITVTGSLDDGKTVVNSVTIVDGKTKVNAESVDKVPEKYRSKVQDLLKSIRMK